MIAYVGQTRTAALIAELERLGIGECTQRGELPPRRSRWFHDCRSFADWIAGEDFNVWRWSRDMMRLNTDCERIAAGRPAHAPASRAPRDQPIRTLPDFIVTPDRVAAGEDSLIMSARWRDLITPHVPAYLVVQNGMTSARVAEFVENSAAMGLPYGGIFVGGDDEWKAATAASWVAFAHARGMRLHIGRAGTAAMVAFARDVGADSIDSSLPLRHADHLASFLRALGLW